MKIVLSVPLLSKVQGIEEDIEEVIRYYLDSKFNGRADDFFGNMAMISDDVMNSLTVEGERLLAVDNKLQNLVNYDIFCSLCQDAIDAIGPALDAGYDRSQMHNLMQSHDLTEVSKLGTDTLVITLQPRPKPRPMPRCRLEVIYQPTTVPDLSRRLAASPRFGAR